MIMDNMKRQSQPKVYLEWYFNTEDLRSILIPNLPKNCEKWLGFLSNDELKNCVEVANILGTERIRMFSFFFTKGQDLKEYCANNGLIYYEIMKKLKKIKMKLLLLMKNIIKRILN